MGQTTSNGPRYRTNPIEIAIFGVIAIVFANSAYQLFYNQQGFQANALSSLAATPASEARIPASKFASLQNIDLNCGIENEVRETNAQKVRLTGNLCGAVNLADAGRLTKTVAVNAANHFTATVFTDVNTMKFSTDYIPLTSGKNAIHLEFSYRDGKTVSQDLAVNRN